MRFAAHAGRLLVFLAFVACTRDALAPIGVDGAAADATVRPDLAGGDMAPCHWFLDTGYCFEHTRRCQSDADCPSPYFGCYGGADRYCRTWNTLDCLYGGDCGDNGVCIKNDRAQGCFPARPACKAAADCAPGDLCTDGFCRQPCCGS